MITPKSLIREIEELGGLGQLVTTYEFIAAAAMRRIRNSVLENRAFHMGLNRIFQEIKRAYEEEIRKFVSRRRFRSRMPIPFLRRPRKTAIVFLSANTSLYGDIIAKTFASFMTEVEKKSADIVIIGRIGRTLFDEEKRKEKYTYFDFPDTTIVVENLKAISRYLSQYEKVVVYHGRFKSLISQDAAATSVSGDELESSGAADEDARYFFEPSLETIVLFFETEIFGSLLEQVFNESRLAKLASRMILLDRASVNVEDALKKMSLERQRLTHRVFNRKQLDLLSGIGLWYSA